MDSSELEVSNEIKSVAESPALCFQNNCMKVNPDKFHNKNNNNNKTEKN